MVTGIDISEEAINTAKYFAKKEGVDSKCTFYSIKSIESIENFPKYDLILLKDIIEHIDEDVKFLKLIVSKLKFNGDLIVTTPNSNSLSHLLGFLYHRIYCKKNTWVGGGDKTHVRIYNTHQLNNIMQNLGLQRIHLQAVGLMPGNLLRYLSMFKLKYSSYISFFDIYLGGLSPFKYFGAGQLNLYRRLDKHF